VCVAGLHDVKEGAKGWFADSIIELEENATQNSANRVLITNERSNSCLYVDETDTVWRFFYPAPEKTYRPFETIKELYGLLGKVIVNKNMPHKVIITSVENNSGTLYINNMSVMCAFNNYVIDETGDPVGVEV
jgi:hypothetical protein